MENRDAIVRKLNGLRAKFMHENTSEAESFAAMEKYNELMQKYDLTETDLTIRESGIKFGKFATDTSNSKILPPMAYMTVPIGWVTDCRGIFDRKTMSAVFIGTMADVQYAEFLWTLIENQFKSSWKAYRYSFDYTKLHRAGGAW